jgi:hypothetical protein
MTADLGTGGTVAELSYLGCWRCVFTGRLSSEMFVLLQKLGPETRRVNRCEVGPDRWGKAD